MTGGMAITAEWEAAEAGIPEIRSTIALLKIAFGNSIATRAEDDWSKSVHPWVRLSAYPLALWLTASWWRLRWESAPCGQPDVSWRMAHEVAAAGHGYIWPRLTFVSDGEAIEAISVTSDSDTTEPIRYVSSFRSRVRAQQFELAVDDFVTSVINRLDDVGTKETELHSLWHELLEEKEDPQTALYRELEAKLGFEPDEAPQKVVNELFQLSAEAGNAAIGEIASACAGRDPSASLERVRHLAESRGVHGRIALPDRLRFSRFDGQVARPLLSMDEPFGPRAEGQHAATQVRWALNLKNEPLPGEELSSLLGIAPSILTNKRPRAAKSQLGLAIRRDASQRVDLLFSTARRTNRRFEAARFLGDHLLAPPDDRWLPTTDARTARQEAQRAFAAELLCPIGAVGVFLDGDHSFDSIEQASEHFGVSPLMLRDHMLENRPTEWSPDSKGEYFGD